VALAAFSGIETAALRWGQVKLLGWRIRPEGGHLWPLQLACWFRFSLEVTSRQATYLSIGREARYPALPYENDFQ
jgi:hypothetical protein